MVGVNGPSIATTERRMPIHPGDHTLAEMLLDILREAEAIRPHDPVRAEQLDAAAADLRMVIAEEIDDHSSAA